MNRKRIGIVLMTAVCLAIPIGLLVIRYSKSERAEERVIHFWHPYTQPQRTEEMQNAAA